MKWKIKKDGIVEDQNGMIVCVMSENANSYHTAIIKNGVEMFNAILDYCQSVENTKYPRNPKMHYDRFQKILENIGEESE